MGYYYNCGRTRANPDYIVTHWASFCQPSVDQKPPKRGMLTNSEDPHEMPHNATFHQGLHCLLWKIDLQISCVDFCFIPLIFRDVHEIISYDPQYTQWTILT